MIKPLKPNVVLKLIEKDVGGIILPEQEKEKHGFGTILEAYGPECRVQPGQKVIFKKYKPEKVELNGEILYIAAEEDVLAIYE